MSYSSRQPGNSMSSQISSSWKIDFCSGLLGGIISVITLAPFDVARTRMALMQITKYGKNRYSGFMGTLNKIYQDEGIKGLFKGVRVTLIANPLYHSLWFMIYGILKDVTKEHILGRDDKYIVPMVASTISGFFCEVVTTPFWMLRTRIQSHFLHTEQTNTGKMESILSHFKKIYKKDGFRGFYRGFFASMIGLGHLAIYAPIYENMKDELQVYSKKFHAWHILLSSMIAKGISVAIIYPVVVIRARLQDSRKKIMFLRNVINDEDEVNLRSVCKVLWRNEGYKGFYSGIKFDLARILISNALIFLVYEGVKYEVLEGWLKSHFED